MMKIGFAIALLFLVACGTTAHDTGIQTVTVNVLGGCPPRSVPGATVELRAADGRLIAEQIAGIDGAVSFRAADVGLGTQLIACHENHSCGLLKLGSTLNAKHYLVVLAPLVIAGDPGEHGDRLSNILWSAETTQGVADE